jgi:hypothetical protein
MAPPDFWRFSLHELTLSLWFSQSRLCVTRNGFFLVQDRGKGKNAGSGKARAKSEDITVPCRIWVLASFAPSGLALFLFAHPTACALGCILSPLRGYIVSSFGGFPAGTVSYFAVG